MQDRMDFEEREELLQQRQDLSNINVRVANIFKFMESIGVQIKNKEALKAEFNARNEEEHKMLQQHFESKLFEWRTENGELNQKNRELINKIRELESDKIRMQSTISQQKNLLDEVKNEKEQIFHEKQDALNEFRVKVEHFIYESEKDKIRNKTLLSENENLAQELQDMTNKLHQAFLKELKDRIDENNSKWNRIQQDREALWKEESDKKRDEYEKMIIVLKQNIQDYKLEIQKWDQKIREITAEQANEKHENSKLKQDNINLTQHISQLNLQRNNFDDQLKNEHRELIEQFTKQKLELTKTRGINDMLKSEIEKLEQRISDFERRFQIESPISPRKRAKYFSFGENNNNNNNNNNNDNDLINQTPSTALYKLDLNVIDSARKKRSYSKMLIEENLINNDNNFHIEETKSETGHDSRSIKLPNEMSIENFPLKLYKTYFDKNRLTYFELRNETHEPVQFQNFSISNDDSSRLLSIPTRPIKPGEIIRVIIGNEQEKKSPEDLVWNVNTNDLWDGKHDQSLLIKDHKENFAEIFKFRVEQAKYVNS